MDRVVDWMAKALGAFFIAAAALVYFMAAGPVQPACLPFRLVTAANTNGTLIVSGTHDVVTAIVTGNNTAAFLHFYDKATAPNTASDTPVQTYGVPASNVATTFGPFSAQPMQFINGLGIAFSANIDGTGNAAANAIVNVCWL